MVTVRCNLDNEELATGGRGLLRDHAEEMAEELLHLRAKMGALTTLGAITQERDRLKEILASSRAQCEHAQAEVLRLKARLIEALGR
jgi:hypothetical protein